MMFPIDHVKRWFTENRRSFPWREKPTAYRVWVSEMMLQQTLASVVVSYFERWIARFPDIASLASAPYEEVIKMWEGLGYYARARYLHEGARYIMEHYGGEFPKTAQDLSHIAGLGSYTKGAILSFAYHQKEPAIDGNVTRVIARYCAIDEEIEKTKTQKMIRHYVHQILPEDESWVVSEALIELGATVCKKMPLCRKCPLMTHCLAYSSNLQNDLPKKKPRKKSTALFRLVAVIEYEGHFLLKKGKEGNVMGGLYEFPYVECPSPPESIEQSLLFLYQEFDFPLLYEKTLPIEKHTFTRFQATLFPFFLRAQYKGEGIWKCKEELLALPFSSGHRRILHKVIS